MAGTPDGSPEGTPLDPSTPAAVPGAPPVVPPAIYRRLLVLAALAAVLLVACLAVVGFAASRGVLDPAPAYRVHPGGDPLVEAYVPAERGVPAVTALLWIGLAGVAALLAATVLHAARVAAATVRRQEP